MASISYVEANSRSGDGFTYVPLPAGLARKILKQLNMAGPSKFAPSTRLGEEQRVEQVYRQWMASQWEEYEQTRAAGNEEQMVWSSGEALMLGYVTHDACPGRGDDIEHIPGGSSQLLDVDAYLYPPSPALGITAVSLAFTSPSIFLKIHQSVLEYTLPLRAG